MTGKRLVVDSIEDLPWIPDVLARSKALLEATPEALWPSWYRDYRAGTLPVMGKPSLAELREMKSPLVPPVGGGV